MDAALSNAQQKLTQLEKQKEVIEAQIARVLDFMRLYNEFANGFSSATQVLESHVAVSAQSSATMSVIDHAKPRVTITEAAKHVIESAGGTPVDTETLLAKVKALGAKITGKTPKISLSSSLSRDDRFENVRGQGWIMAKGEPPDADTSSGSDLLSSHNGSRTD